MYDFMPINLNTNSMYLPISLPYTTSEVKLSYIKIIMLNYTGYEMFDFYDAQYYSLVEQCLYTQILTIAPIQNIIQNY